MKMLVVIAVFLLSVSLYAPAHAREQVTVRLHLTEEVAKMNEPQRCYQHRSAALTQPANKERAMAELQPIYGFNHPQLNILLVEYRDIPGWPGYRVSNVGSVWTARKNMGLGHKGGSIGVVGDVWKKRRPCLVGKYLGLNLGNVEAEFKRVYVHHVVLEVFVGQRPEGMEACHNNGDRLDNWIGNLR